MWNAQDSEDEVLAMVVRVKLDTIMGSMVRKLIAPDAAVKEKQPFEAVSPALLPIKPALQCCHLLMPCKTMTLPSADAFWTRLLGLPSADAAALCCCPLLLPSAAAM